MRITPLEIRQKSFEKHFRGYDKDEVNGFLLTLSQEWERLLDEGKELRIRLEATEREVTKLREVEGSLYKTLKTAEDTGASVIEQAKTAADLHLKESQLKAEAIINEAKGKARDAVEESEMRVKQIVADMEDRLELLVDNYKKLETSRADLLSEMKRMASDTVDRIERAKILTSDFDPDKFIAAARREARSLIYPNGEYVRAARPHAPDVQESSKATDPEQPASEGSSAPAHDQGNVEPQPVEEGSYPKKVQRSFFDDIE